MHQYLTLMQDILDNGVQTENRTGTNTLSVFGREMRFDLSKGFPLLTTKKLHTRSIFYELIWFLRGRNDVKWLNDRGVRIWNEWAKEDGTIGPGYGVQWRSWPYMDYDTKKIETRIGLQPSWAYIDQLHKSLDTLKENPNCRRNIVSAWNVPFLDEMALPPCHLLFQFGVADNKLTCVLYQRSCDFWLGVPFNVASYALLTMIMARMTGLELGEFIWYGFNVHLYNNHLDQAKLQLTREPRELPTMLLKYNNQGLDDWEYEDFELVNYNPHPGIKAKVSV